MTVEIVVTWINQTKNIVCRIDFRLCEATEIQRGFLCSMQKKNSSENRDNAATIFVVNKEGNPFNTFNL